MSHALALHGLAKRYGDFVAVHGADLDVAAGSFLTLLGPSGSGKTTILMMIAGFAITATIAGKLLDPFSPERLLAVVGCICVVAFVLACVDIDNLAAINAEFGQAAGDEAIRQISRMIRAGLRVEDLAARVGPDELGMLLTEVGLDFGVPILQSIRSAAGNAEFSFGGQTFKGSISIGAALWDPSVDTRAELHARVQSELKRAKVSGKNQVCWR